MVGSRQLERIVSQAAERGAKVVLVGDAEQLQPIEAGAAFRAIAERVGYQELSGIRRQREAWQRNASYDFARGAAGPGLQSLSGSRRDPFRREPGQGQRGSDQSWAEYRAAQGAEKASLILAHTRADVRELNLQARAILKERGELGKEARVEVARELAADDGTISIERGERYFAQGDRVMFLKNDRELGVKNGTLGHGCRSEQGFDARGARRRRAARSQFRTQGLCGARLRLCRHRAQGPGRHGRSNLHAGHPRHGPPSGLRRHDPPPRRRRGVRRAR